MQLIYIYVVILILYNLDARLNSLTVKQTFYVVCFDPSGEKLSHQETKQACLPSANLEDGERKLQSQLLHSVM